MNRIDDWSTKAEFFFVGPSNPEIIGCRLVNLCKCVKYWYSQRVWSKGELFSRHFVYVVRLLNQSMTFLVVVSTMGLSKGW